LLTIPRLFNFAIGLFIPPGFENISWKLFIIFGVLCIGAAIQAFFTYHETAGKTLEEIEIMFRKGGPRPWHTKPGGSLLDQKILEVQAGGRKESSGIAGGTEEERMEYGEKRAENV